MKKLFFAFLLVTIAMRAQTEFDKGYFIKSGGDRVNCLIRNGPSVSNPSRVEYREVADGPIMVQNIAAVQEFGIDSVAIYKRFTVQIDRSLNDPNRLSKMKEPQFKTETLFLKLLVSGAANLYEYIDGNLVRFFFETHDRPIEQLIYKKYLYTPDAEEQLHGRQGGMATNNRFRQQLQSFVSVAPDSNIKAEKTDYNQESLVRYFLAATSSVKTPTRDNFIQKSNKNVFKKNGSKLLALRLQPGANFEQITFADPFSNAEEKAADVSSSAGFRIGAELEIIIPSRTNFWSIFLSPTYSKIHSDGSILTNDGFFVSQDVLEKITIDYTELELAVGGRFGIFLGKNSKIYADVAAGIAMLNKYELKLSGSPDFEVNQIDGKDIQGGFGYVYKKFSIEGRVLGKKKIGLESFESKVSGFALILGYNFL